MKTIHKYIIAKESYSERFSLYMPVGCKILTSQLQGNELCIWAEIETNKNRRNKYFAIFGTGNPMDSHPMEDYEVLRYISTVQEGVFVWHIYEYL